MINYWKALRARKQALKQCRQARQELHDSVDDVVGMYQAHALPALAGAAGIGFVLAQFHAGSGLMRTGVRTATGPAWHLVRHYFDALS